MNATEKQLKYMMFLIGLLERKLKQNYEYYGKTYDTVVALMESGKSAVEHGNNISKSTASQMIQIFKDTLDAL